MSSIGVGDRIDVRKMLAMRYRRAPLEVDELIVDTLEGDRRALTAYELVHRLAKRRQHIAPAQAYRALGRLVERRQITRIESLNAYCRAEFVGETAVLLCRACHCALSVELEGLEATLSEVAIREGFRTGRIVAEVTGTCPSCLSQAPERTG